jgi:Protein of unknown function (DUF2911)
MTRTVAAVMLVLTAAATSVLAQAPRPASPRASAATEIRGKYVPGKPAATYQGGKWIEITYSAPIKRGRELFGSGAAYGQALNAGAPVWRAGADVSTRLRTEVPLNIGGKPIPAGEYSLFVDLKPNNWTLIVSTWGAQADYDPNDKTALWGSYGYTPDKDAARAPMRLETLPHAFDQLTWSFIDMSDTGGTIALIWDKVMATTPFRIG